MLDIWHSYSVTVICFLVVVFCLWRALFLKKDFFHPVNVYAFAQCLTLGVAYLKLDPAMTDFRITTWLVWSGAMAAFVLGSGLYYAVAYEREKLPIVYNTAPLENYSWKAHFAYSLFLFFFFLVGVFGVTSVAGTLIVFSENPSQWVSSDVNYWYWPVFQSSAPLAAAFFALGSFKKLNPYKRLRIISRIFVVIIPIIAFMSYPNRSVLFLCVGWLIILYNYVGKKIDVKYIIFAMIFAVGFFVFVSQLRAQYSTNSIMGLAAKQVMLMPYRYVANNYWNLDYALNPSNDREIHPYTYGVDAIYGMFEYTKFTPVIRKMMHWDDMFNKSVQKVDGLNTTGYLWEVYKDWGIAGTVLFPFIISFFMSFFYEKMIREASPRTWLLYSLFLYYIGWWWFLEGYKRGLFWLWIYLIFLFTLLCKKREKKIEASSEVSSDASAAQ